MSSKAFLVMATCGDFYCGGCGCDWGHVVGVALTEQDAERIRIEAGIAEIVYADGSGKRKKWFDVDIDRVPVNELLPGEHAGV